MNAFGKFWFFVWTLIVGSSAWCAPDLIKSGEFELRLMPTPAWVQPASVHVAQLSKQQAGAGAASSKYLFQDMQVDFRRGGTLKYVRYVILVQDQETLKGLGEFQVSYSSVFNKASLHHIHVYRQGAKLNKLEPAAIKLVREEKDWDQRILTGYVKAFMPIRDLRLGDVLDVAFSVDGENPILGKKARVSLSEQSQLPKDMFRGRVLTDAHRPLQYKSFKGALAPVELKKDGHIEYLMQRQNVAASVLQAQTPRWDDPDAFVQFSEYQNWTEVVDWGMALFAQEDKGAPAVAELARKFMAMSNDPQERVAHALKFVQEDIRYLSESLGSNAYMPYAPSLVLQRRYGDCKDKTNLLVALVRGMGYEAYPALVSSTLRHKLTERLPGSQTFDHVIAKVLIDGKAFWLDSTMSHQPRALTGGSVPMVDHALVLKKGETNLTSLDVKHYENHRIDTVFNYTFTALNQPGKLNALVKSKGWFASAAQTARDSGRLDQLMEALFAMHSRFQPGFSLVDKPAMTVDNDSGEVQIRYSAVIKGGFSDDSQSLPALSLLPGFVIDFSTMNASQDRRQTLYLTFPTTVTHRDVLEFPEDLANSRQQINDQVGDGLIDFSRSLITEGRKVEMLQKLVLKRDYVMPDEIPAAAQTRRRIREKLITAYRPYPVRYRDFVLDLSQNTKRDFSRMSQSDYSGFVLRRYQNDIEFLKKRLDIYDLDAKSRGAILKEISVKYSLSAEKAKAIQAIDEAIELDGSKNSELLSHKGQYIVGEGQFSDGKKLLEKAKELGASDAETFRYLSLAEYYLGNYKAALGWSEQVFAASTGAESRWFALVNMKLAAMRADVDFAPYDAKYVAELGKSDEFAARLYGYLKGVVSEHELQMASRSSDGFKSWRNRAELNYYMAQKARKDGDISRAKQLLLEVLALNVVDFIETPRSRFDLAELER